MRSAVRFSVITVCFNDKQNLLKTAASLQELTSNNWEWVVVDGASTDGTVEYLQELNMPQLRWISEPDRGIYDAFNKGTHLARGDYLIYICAGDRFSAPDVLRRVDDFISEHPGHSLYYGDSHEVDADGVRHLRLARHHSRIWWNLFTHHQAMFYAKECFDRCQYDPNYRIGGDYAFTAELLHKGGTAIKMPFCIADFLLGGTSQKNYWKGEYESWAARRRLGVPLHKRAGIFAAHAAIRWGRTSLPGLYKLARYAPAQSEPHTAPVADGRAQTPRVSAVKTENDFWVGGVRVNCMSLDDAIQKIFDVKKAGQSFCVFTANLDHVVKLRHEPRFREAYRRATVVLADGFPIALAGRLARRQVSRAAGSDLIEPLCERAAEEGLRVFLLGSTGEVLADCASKLQEKYHGLEIAGRYAPPGRFDPFSPQAMDVIDIVKAARPDICFVALGSPKGELFAARCLDHLQGTALVCIGAGLDFIAGMQKRAPRLVRNVGLEWFWRLAHNPGRLAMRYAQCGYVLPSVLVQTALRQGGPGQAAAMAEQTMGRQST